MGNNTVAWSITHGCPFHCTIHDPWVPIPLYGPWPMGAHSIVRSMTHGDPYHHTVHDPWVPLPLYDPWPMGAHSTIRSMGHGCPFHCTIHDPWVPIPPYDPWPMGTPSMCHGSYDDVWHCFSHDSWGFVTITVPMTHGKKSLNPVPWTSLLLSRISLPASTLTPTIPSIPPNNCTFIISELLLINHSNYHPINVSPFFRPLLDFGSSPLNGDCASLLDYTSSIRY